jgi:hypothetical protein
VPPRGVSTERAATVTISPMELVWGATLWALWSCWLLCQHLAAPWLFTRASAGLLVGELAMLAVHSFDCQENGCGPAGRAAGSAATADIPALAVLLVAMAAVHGWRTARRSSLRRR